MIDWHDENNSYYLTSSQRILTKKWQYCQNRDQKQFCFNSILPLQATQGCFITCKQNTKYNPLLSLYPGQNILFNLSACYHKPTVCVILCVYSVLISHCQLVKWSLHCIIDVTFLLDGGCCQTCWCIEVMISLHSSISWIQLHQGNTELNFLLDVGCC